MTMTRPGRRPRAGVMRRPVVVLGLGELRGPGAGVIEPPRRVWWSGRPAVDLADRGQAALFYEQLLDVGSPADIAAWANPGLLARLWPALGGRAEVRRGWMDANPLLAEADLAGTEPASTEPANTEPANTELASTGA